MQWVGRLPLLFARCGVELELALLRLGERLEVEAALPLGLLAQRAQLEVVGGVERRADRHVVLDQLEKLPPTAVRLGTWSPPGRGPVVGAAGGRMCALVVCGGGEGLRAWRPASRAR